MVAATAQSVTGAACRATPATSAPAARVSAEAISCHLPENVPDNLSTVVARPPVVLMYSSASFAEPRIVVTGSLPVRAQ